MNQHSTRALTDRQADVLACIDGFMIEQGRPPTFREIMAMVGIRSLNGMTYHVVQFEKKGFLAYDRGDSGHSFRQSRAIRIVRRRDGDRVLIRGLWVHDFTVGGVPHQWVFPEELTC